MGRHWGWCFALLLIGCQAAPAARDAPFYIQVIDDQTGRGVPLVKLSTVDKVCFYTDSHGVAAIDDPVFNGRKVFFFVSSDGYDFPADFIGSRGEAVQVLPGASTTFKIHRLNIAERLYRLTGEGIYRDSVLVGRRAPSRRPLLNGEVVGQDSAMTAVYRDRIYWFFGDTSRLRYALGHFRTSGAMSQLPGKGGLDPSVGVDLTYFVDDEGFSRPMLPELEQPLAWLDGLMVLKDEAGREQMLGVCSNLKNGDEVSGRYLVQYNDREERFDLLQRIDEMSLRPRGHALVGDQDGVPYLYFVQQYPNIRVKADLADAVDASRYEAFTCLKPGERYKSNAKADWAAAEVERDDNGKIVWAWKRNTAQVDDEQLGALIDAHKLRQDEAWFRPEDAESKEYVQFHYGDVAYNAFRHKWIMINGQTEGSSSALGEIWYLEADLPEGPWKWARKVITHDRYSFYNPVLHPYFDQQGGRIVYFEGTYSTFLSRNDSEATPRYDYNQIMYRLDLADPRLTMPP